MPIARRVARRYRCIAAITGAVDCISDGVSSVAMRNGHILMRQVTGTGCMTSSLSPPASARAPYNPC